MRAEQELSANSETGEREARYGPRSGTSSPLLMSLLLWEALGSLFNPVIPAQGGSREPFNLLFPLREALGSLLSLLFPLREALGSLLTTVSHPGRLSGAS